MTDFLTEYLFSILGDKSLAGWAAAFTFVFIGVVVSLRVSVGTRDKSSPNTPTSFNFKFLVQDNVLRILGSLFVTFSCIRFGEELFNITMNAWGCFLLGFFFDRAFSVLKEWQNKGRDVFKPNNQ